MQGVRPVCRRFDRLIGEERLPTLLIRNAFRLASKREWDALKRAVKPIYTAIKARGHLSNEVAALKCLYLVTGSLDLERIVPCLHIAASAGTPARPGDLLDAGR
jgi:hypothetical protein